MKLYAEVPGRRIGQIVSDLLLAVAVFALVRLGFGVRDLVSQLAGPGVALEGAGRDLERAAEQTGERVAELPLVGEPLSGPFEAVAGSGRALAEAGVQQQEVVATVALALGVLLAALPILALLIAYLPGRIRWMTAASAGARLRGEGADLSLFAFRALAHQPLEALRRVSRDPWADFAEGNLEPLAALELHQLGLRPTPRRRLARGAAGRGAPEPPSPRPPT